MNEMMRVFSYESNQIRVVEKDGEPWWVLADVCQVLGLTNSRVTAKQLDEDEKGVSPTYTPGGIQNMTVVNEPGLYSVILRSDKKETKEFKRWITHEVIPSIRKTGQYGAISGETLAQFVQLTDCVTRLADRVEKRSHRRTKGGNTYKPSARAGYSRVERGYMI